MDAIMTWEVFMWVSDCGSRLTKSEIEVAHNEGLFTNAEYAFYASEAGLNQ
jgi:hypothetical protein